MARIRRDGLVRIIVLGAIGVMVTLMINAVLVRLVTRPVGALVDVVRRIGAGEFGVLAPGFSTDELDTLGKEVSRMSIDLESRERERAGRLAKARRIQEHLQPASARDGDDAVAVYFGPAEDVAGDYYDIIGLSDGSTLVCLADVCGHGVPAAMGASLLKALLLSAAEQITSPADFMKRLNRLYLRVALPGDFASMVLVRIDPSSPEIEFASAGHEPCYIVRDDGSLGDLNSTGMLLGVSADAEWHSKYVMVSSSDRLVLVTDGVSEAPNSDRHRFGRDRLSALLTTLGGRSPRDIARAISDAVAAHRAGTAADDDQTVVVLQPAAIHSDVGGETWSADPAPGTTAGDTGEPV